MSSTKLRRVAQKTLSVTLTTTTSLWLVGASFMVAAPVAQAIGNETLVTDVSGTNPRIAQNGESERVVLGISLARTTGTDVVQLQSIRVNLTSDDTADEAAVANIEEVRMYRDSSLSGANGVFDENDSELDPDGVASAATRVDRDTNIAGGADSTLNAQTALASVDADSFGHGIAAPTTTICLDDAAAAGLAVGDAIAFVDGSASTTFNRIVTVVAPITDADAAGTACVSGSSGVNTHTLITVDTVMAGVAIATVDAEDTVTEVNNYPAGITALSFVDESNVAAADEMKVGTGLTAEIWTVGTNLAIASNSWLAVGGTVYAHAAGEVVQETAQEIAANGGTGFQTFAANATVVEFGDPDNTAGFGVDDEDAGYDIPLTDASDEAGADLFVTLVTQGGAVDQTVRAQVWTGDIIYRNETGNQLVTASVSSGVDTTLGQTKSITYGADGVAPTITKVESFDTSNNGTVNRFKVYFSESMASTVTASNNFASAIAGTQNRVNALDASTIDLNLGVITWLTTTVLNDTAQIEVTNAAAYTSFAQSTGDAWTMVYDQGLTANDMKDATGQDLLDTTITTTDKARARLVSAELRDADGDSKMDELRVLFSESLGAASDAAGFDLKNTTITGSPSYTLGSVLGFITSTPAGFNSNDTIRIAVTENASNDVGDAFTLSYTASATVVDIAGNEAQSRSGVVPAAALNPVIISVEYNDLNTIGGGTANNGRIDTVVVTFNVAINERGGVDARPEFALSNGYALAGASTGDGTAVYTMGITEKLVDDTDVVPDLTYNDDGDTTCLTSTNGGGVCTTDQLLTVTSSGVVEADKARPVIQSATLYETTANDIWETGETLQLVMSEPIDAATLDAGWNVNAATGTTFSNDFWLTNNGNVFLIDGAVPDSGTVTVTGNVIILTPTANASVALGGTDRIHFKLNEVKDLAANSGLPDLATSGGGNGGTAVPLTVTPTTAPTIAKVSTRDLNGNGILDGLILHLNGLVDSATIAAADFGASKGANFTGGEAGTSTVAAPADLAISSVATLNGGNDSRVVVTFAEANEDTGNHPQMKYVQGALADLAANKVASFNQNTSDNALFMTGLLLPAALDEADPIVLYRGLDDRNSNGKIDQVTVVFSERMAIGNLASTGWALADHVLATNGAYSNNLDFQAFTFAITNVVYRVEVTELSPESSSMPGLSYASSGVFQDLQGRLLGNVAAGGEVSSIMFVAAPPTPGVVNDGELFQLTGGDGSIWIAKHVGAKKFRRHVLWGDFDVIYPHLAPMWPVQETDQATYDMYTLSAWIRVVGSAPVYEVNDDMTAHWITCDDDSVAGQDCANEWLAAGGDPDGIYEINGAGGEWARLTLSNPVILPDVTN